VTAAAEQPLPMWLPRLGREVREAADRTWPPAPQARLPQPAVRGGAGRLRGDLSVTDRVSREELTLPLWSDMDEVVLDRVIAGVAPFFGA
jgi:dTDP-4-amino-4,6-dideoxygalactose transaminase